MKTYFDFINDILESRTYTHELGKSTSILIKWLNTYKLKYHIDLNHDTQDFQLYIFNNNNFDQELFDIIITMTQNLGFFPAVLKIDDRFLLDDYKEYCNIKNIIINDKKEIDYINFLKSITFDNFNEIYFQFERYKDFDVDFKNIPDIIYHVCKKDDVENIKKYGLIPKSKSKISFHPERIYLTKNGAESLLKQFKKISDTQYSILSISVSDSLKKHLYLKNDPNIDDGYYTTTNIPPDIIKIE